MRQQQQLCLILISEINDGMLFISYVANIDDVTNVRTAVFVKIINGDCGFLHSGTMIVKRFRISMVSCQKGPTPQGLRVADMAILAGYPRYHVFIRWKWESLYSMIHRIVLYQWILSYVFFFGNTAAVLLLQSYGVPINIPAMLICWLTYILLSLSQFLHLSCPESKPCFLYAMLADSFKILRHILSH